MKNFLTLLFVIFTILLSVFSLQNLKPVNTDIVTAFLDEKYSEKLVKLSKLASNKINVVFETSSYEENERLKSDFLAKIDKADFVPEIDDFSGVLEFYEQHPGNFLTAHKRNLIKKENFAELEKESLSDLYNPAGIIVETPDKDPYLFLTAYVKSFAGFDFAPSNDVVGHDGKYYSYVPLSLVGKTTAVKDLITLQNSFNEASDGHVYLTGALIHSWLTSSKSVAEINVICMISFLALFLLCKFFFKSAKIFFPVVISILFGIFFGYVVTNLVFASVNVLTFVFSTTLIGISLDYSLHYYFTERDKSFYKSLTCSMLTTVLAFFVPAFTNIPLLHQTAVFTGFGLIGVYLFVVLILPLFKFEIPAKSLVNIPDFSRFKKQTLIFVTVLLFLGLFQTRFVDDVKSFYVPGKDLMNAEKLFNNVFPRTDTAFVPVEGNNIEELLQNEERIADELAAKNIPYLCLSKFVPSEKRRAENQKLIKSLYRKNLSSYATFLDFKTIETLKVSLDFDKIEPFDYEKYHVLKNFSVDEKTSFIVVPKDADVAGKITVSRDISKVVGKCRIRCLKILPFAFLTVFGFLVCVFGVRKALKILLSPLLGAGLAVSILSLFGCTLNVFNVLALFLILGFSLDYSIFRLADGTNSETAVFVSCLSTVFSFFLLSLTSFALVSSMGKILYIGIATAYLLSIVLLPNARRS